MKVIAMTELKDKSTIVVETRGGTVVAMYGDGCLANVVLVDWDEFFDQRRPGIVFELDPLSKMPDDTRSLVEQGLADMARDDSPSRR